MHFDFTLHFWSLIVQLATFAGVVAFLHKVYQGVKSVVDAILLILKQHREMHSWYQGVKDKWPVVP